MDNYINQFGFEELNELQMRSIAGDGFSKSIEDFANKHFTQAKLVSPSGRSYAA